MRYGKLFRYNYQYPYLRKGQQRQSPAETALARRVKEDPAKHEHRGGGKDPGRLLDERRRDEETGEEEGWEDVAPEQDAGSHGGVGIEENQVDADAPAVPRSRDWLFRVPLDSANGSVAAKVTTPPSSGTVRDGYTVPSIYPPLPPYIVKKGVANGTPTLAQNGPAPIDKHNVHAVHSTHLSPRALVGADAASDPVTPTHYIAPSPPAVERQTTDASGSDTSLPIAAELSFLQQVSVTCLRKVNERIAYGEHDAELCVALEDLRLDALKMTIGLRRIGMLMGGKAVYASGLADSEDILAETRAVMAAEFEKDTSA